RRGEKARGTARKALHAQTNKAGTQKGLRSQTDPRRGFGRIKFKVPLQAGLFILKLVSPALSALKTRVIERNVNIDFPPMVVD
ncbi:MAG: hypothetical protein WBW71_09670, partial [Bacteroidota bacterium]